MRSEIISRKTEVRNLAMACVLAETGQVHDQPRKLSGVARTVGGSNKEGKKITAWPVDKGKERDEKWRS